MTPIDKTADISQLKDLEKYLHKIHEDIVLETYISEKELTIIGFKPDILKLLKFLHDDSKCRFKMLIDLCGVDYPDREKRFDVVYHLLSLEHNMRVRVKVHVADGDSVLSVCELFAVANWYERETYDMFGIPFENHPDLRRLLTDYDFDGHPLRKDFPVEGKVEVYYDENEKRVAYKPVDMPQEYRHFDDVSPWKAMDNNRHLAEKDSVFELEEFAKDKQKVS